MGYMIIRVTSGDTRYIGWAEDSTTIAYEMANWLTRGQTMEILEYVPDIDPRTDANLIPQLNLWRDHLNEEQTNGL